MTVRQSVCVGIDIGKAAHHACAIDARGSVVLSRRVTNDQHDLERLIAEMAKYGGGAEVVWAVDLTNELAGWFLPP